MPSIEVIDSKEFVADVTEEVKPTPSPDIKEVESPKERAIELKNKGNTLFKDGKYEEAITFFTQAIELNQTDAAFFHNRSFCYFKLGKFAETVDDATHAIDLKKTYVKAYFRRALGRAELDNLS
ncbi:Serine/threonine-protein phosphatase 5, partial [Aduncisulcus paluster]